MKVRLFEVEVGVSESKRSRDFYTRILGLEVSFDQPGIAGFESGSASVKFNVSHHIPAQETCLNFLTDNIKEIIARLRSEDIPYTDPEFSDLGMITISFRDPDGFLVKVNEPTNDSPPWLKV